MAYATIQDLIDCYGEEEIICLTDKDQPRTGAVNTTRAQCMLDRACAEIDAALVCCGFDIKAIKDAMLTSGATFGILKHWNLAIARYLLYDTIRLDVNAGGSDHEAHRRYEDYEEEIQKICECGRLPDDLGNVYCVSNPQFAIKSEPTCLPKNICCGCDQKNCCCGELG